MAAADLLVDLQPRAVGQAKVQNNHVEGVHTDAFEPGLGAARDMDSVRRRREGAAQVVRRQSVAVADEQQPARNAVRGAVLVDGSNA